MVLLAFNPSSFSFLSGIASAAALIVGTLSLGLVSSFLILSFCSLKKSTTSLFVYPFFLRPSAILAISSRSSGVYPFINSKIRIFNSTNPVGTTESGLAPPRLIFRECLLVIRVYYYFPYRILVW